MKQEKIVWIVQFKRWHLWFKTFPEINIQAQWMLQIFKEEILPVANYQAIIKKNKDQQSNNITHKHKGKILNKIIATRMLYYVNHRKQHHTHRKRL